MCSSRTLMHSSPGEESVLIFYINEFYGIEIYSVFEPYKIVSRSVIRVRNNIIHLARCIP